MAIKSKEQILQQLLKRLVDNTEIVDVDPGSIARTFSEVLSEEFYQFYNELNLTTTMTFVSTASGQFLDLIGALLNCARVAGETDANYRSRITNQVFVIAGGNVTSIRLRVLSIEGVKDVIMREFTRGTGSFSIYPITDSPQTPVSIINQVEDIVTASKSFGIFTEVKSPVLIPVDLKVRLIFNDKTSDAEKATLRQNVKQNVKGYIDGLGMGGTFVINDVIRTAMNTSTKIVDINVTSLKVASVNQFAKNFNVNWDERIVIESLDVV